MSEPQPSVLIYATPAEYTKGGPWRKEDLLITTRSMSLPNRCIKCNKPANGFSVKKRYLYTPEWTNALVVATFIFWPLLPFVMVIFYVLGKSARLEIGLCTDHRRVRIHGYFFYLPLVLVSLAGILIALIGPASERISSPLALVVCGVAFVVMVAAFIGFVYSTSLLQPQRIDKSHGRFRGACDAYLDELPEFPS